jgi:hypothetical protein
VSTLSEREIAQYAYAAGFRGERLAQAVAIAIAESNGKTDLRGDTDRVDAKWGPSVGLWQIRSLQPAQRDNYPHEYPLREPRGNLDPLTNARHAYTISQGGREWELWASYGGARYREVMDRAKAAARQVTLHPPTRGDLIGGGRGGRGDGHQLPARPDRIVLDLAELHALETFMADAADRIRHTRTVLDQIDGELRAAGAAPTEPALAGLIRSSFDYLAAPATLHKIQVRLDWHARCAARARRLAEQAGGADSKWTRCHAPGFGGHGYRHHKTDHAERAVLEGSLPGRIVRNRDLRRHLDRSGRGGAPPRLPAVNLAGLHNARIPAGRLAPIGDGERLLGPVSRQFLRMRAAASTAGLNLQVDAGYRDHAEQQRLYNLYLSGRGNLAEKPGLSDHGWGLSVDLHIPDHHTFQWLAKHAGEYGFVNDVAGERRRWTYRPSPASH